MIERMTTRTNKNGNALQIEIDHEAHTVERGYYLFHGELSSGKGYCYWNESGNRNYRAIIYCEYNWTRDGRAI